MLMSTFVLSSRRPGESILTPPTLRSCRSGDLSPRVEWAPDGLGARSLAPWLDVEPSGRFPTRIGTP